MTHDLTPEDRALIELTRPIIGIENRTAQEAFDIMVDRIRNAGRQEGRRSPGEGGDMLAWLADRHSLELDYGYDDQHEDMFWRVHKRSGNVNDREWDLIGQGATPLAALLSAKSFLESTRSEQSK